MSYLSPRPLASTDVLDGFDSASSAQNEWLVRFARSAHASGSAKVFVVVLRDAPDRVVAFYGWSMASVSVGDLPERMRRGAGRYPQPAALLARLAVHRDHEGRGLGAALLKDVIVRFVAISDEIGCRVLLIHCETEAARNFYLHLVPEFERSPTDDLHLLILLKDARRTVESTHAG